MQTMTIVSVTGLLCVLLMLAPAARAEDFVFSCKDNWQRQREVPVSADSVQEARQVLKSGKPASTGNKQQNTVGQCTYRRENRTTSTLRPLPDRLQTTIPFLD